MSGIVNEIGSAQFDAEVLDAKVPVVVDFWAPWCGPCRLVAPEMEKLAELHGESVKFVKMNVDDNREIALRYDVMSIPTILKFERGAVADQAVGAMKAEDLNKALRLG